MHFFSPANVMPLLEVVRTAAHLAGRHPDGHGAGQAAAQDAGARAGLLRLHRQPHDGRLRARGAAHGARGRDTAAGRRARSRTGAWRWASSPCSTWRASTWASTCTGRTPSRYPPDPAYYQADVALHEAGRLGQKNGKGYYRYEPGNRTRIDDPEAIEILRATRARAADVRSVSTATEEILERCLYPLMNEGFRILGEGIALRAADIDVVWTSGYGFPRYRGGPMFHAEVIGLEDVAERHAPSTATSSVPCIGSRRRCSSELVERGLQHRGVGARQRAKRAQP